MKLVFYTLAVSMAPVVELRGAIPMAVAAGMDIWKAYIIAVIGNMIPVPFIIIFIRSIFKWMRTKSPRLNRLVSRMEAKADSKAATVQKYEKLGLFILVAIPLPGTGAWTGALVAVMMDMRLRTAVPMILLGVMAAGIIVSMIVLGVVSI